MVTGEPRIPGSAISGGGVTPLRRRARDEVNEEERPSATLKKRGRFDPTNIEGALKRLAKLLTMDREVPRQDVMPRGFYLDILV